jgi:hypothetical protein
MPGTVGAISLARTMTSPSLLLPISARARRVIIPTAEPMRGHESGFSAGPLTLGAARGRRASPRLPAPAAMRYNL